jgi:hypothetical protein
MLCVALTACGKSTDDKYKQEFPPIDRGLVALGRDVDDGLRGAQDRRLAGDFSGYARRLGQLRERLAALEPPDALQGRHAELLAAMRATHGDLTGVAEAARRGDAAAAGAAATRLVRDEARLEGLRSGLARAARSL